MVLSAIYEPLFEEENVNFGFRPRLGCQNAIQVLRKKAQGMDFAIEGDIKGAYNNLIHKKLIKILSQRIKDKKFLKLIWEMCRAGVFDAIHKIRTATLIGVPQGGIVSPLLWNIYMHEFDLYINTEIDDILQDINTKQNRKNSIAHPEYKSLMAKRKNRLQKWQEFFE